MTKLIYSAICSLDGFIEDSSGEFGWAAPDEEVHQYVNDLERPIGTYLYGRRMYETMRFWETQGDGADDGPVSSDFAQLWRAADKVVYSRTLQTAETARTRVEHDFEPADIRRLKAAIRAGRLHRRSDAGGRGLPRRLDRRVSPFPAPGHRRRRQGALPADVRVQLSFIDERRFRSGVVHLHYQVAPLI